MAASASRTATETREGYGRRRSGRKNPLPAFAIPPAEHDEPKSRAPMA